MQNINIQD